MRWAPGARVCFEDTLTLTDTNPRCSNAAAHTPSPADYGGFFTWARRMGKTHVQLRCPACQLFLIWTPKDQCPTCGRLYAPTPSGVVRAHGTPHCLGSYRTPAPPTQETVADAND